VCFFQPHPNKTSELIPWLSVRVKISR
jgi:hypothetical protein